MENIKKYNRIREEVYRETLDNGLKVSINLKKGFKKFFVLFGTNFGSLINKFMTSDGKINNTPLGVAHFLEHKLFACENDMDATNLFSKYGLDVNAYTDYSQTVYLFSGTNYLKEGLEILLDFVQTPYFTDKNVEDEKSIICQELKMYMDNPGNRLFNGLLNNLYKEFGYKYDVGGTIEEVTRTTKEDLYLCYNNYYHPSQMELLIIGDVDYKEIMDVIKENQKSKTFNNCTYPKFIFEKEDVTPVIKHKEENMDVVFPKVAVGFKLPFYDLQYNEFMLIETGYRIILEHYFGIQTEFYQELIEDDIISNGLSFSAQLNEYCGFILFRADTHNPQEFIKRIKKQVNKVNKFIMTDEEFNRIKKAITGNLIKAFNSIEYIGYNYLDYNARRSDLFEIVNVIDKLSIEYLKELSVNFKDELISSFIINPINK